MRPGVVRGLFAARMSVEPLAGRIEVLFSLMARIHALADINAGAVFVPGQRTETAAGAGCDLQQINDRAVARASGLKEDIVRDAPQDTVVVQRVLHKKREAIHHRARAPVKSGTRASPGGTATCPVRG